MQRMLPLIVLLGLGCRAADDIDTSAIPSNATVLAAIPANAISKDSVASSDSTITNSLGMQLVRIPAGSFLMGSADTDPGAREDEKPQHRVRISRAFYLGAFEVTQHQYLEMMDSNPSSFTKEGLLAASTEDLDVGQLPAENITWFGALEFCRRLSALPAEQKAGRLYRLPYEAEWEYACRAGTTTVFHCGDTLSSEQANFNGNYPFGDAKLGPFLNRTSPVGSYPPNAFGLYDMHGNLNEWCLDKFDRAFYQRSSEVDPIGSETGTSPVIRGGDWYSDGRDCRSAFRYADLPEGKFYALGFRIVCELISEGASLHPLVANPESWQPSVQTSSSQEVDSQKVDLLAAEAWPQWRGPRRDGSWQAPPLPDMWSDSGLSQIWKRKIGGGYGGVAVAEGSVVVMDRQIAPSEAERILCFTAQTGEPRWQHSYAVDYDGVAYDNGPRATPTIHEGRVYTLGAVGHFHCLSLQTGEVVWSKDLVSEMGARVPIWGLSASPVIFQDLVIVHPGAEANGCYMAFDRMTGELRWKNLSDAAGYSTPQIEERNGQAEIIAWTPVRVCGLNPYDGELLWSVPFEVNYGTSVADPIFHEGIVLVSSYYDGSLAVRPGTNEDEVEDVWHDHRNLRALMSQPLYRDGYVYMLDRRHGLTCFELATGDKQWDDDNRLTPKGRNPQATLVWLADEDRAIALNSDGDLILIRLNPDGYVEESRTNIIGRTWAHPAYAGNCVFARSDRELICVLLE